ncbi:MAG: 4a-hydroxytetrahydrobiopterin dehydratase [Elusimicrobia bacterium]|nr:4a-hydroxytetrahydrobiopterin dehydratase [Elusimicrobiota bacterium]
MATTMDDLTRKHCIPCEQGGEPMPAHLAQTMLQRVKGWTLAEGKRLRQDLVMKDFAEAVRFIGEIARVADAEDHHPDLHLTGYRKLTIELTTHAVGGLTENDFILAAKIDTLPRQVK